MATWADLLNYKQYVVRSDGAKFRDGVRDDNLDTSWLTISPTVSLGPGLYDELMVLRRIATQEEIEAWAQAGAPWYDPSPVIPDAQIPSADGWNRKVRTYYQTAAPVAEGIGDIWFDTDDGNRPRWWDGSQWVDAHDKLPIDANERPISACGSGGYIEFDKYGQRFIRNSDGKMMIKFDTETGDATFGGKLEADEVMAGIMDAGGVTADHMAANTLHVFDKVPGTAANGKVTINSSGVNITDGKLTVKNPAGTTIIDGTSRMFRIHQTGTVNIPAGSYRTIGFPSLGYRPACLAYMLGTTDQLAGRSVFPYYIYFERSGAYSWGIWVHTSTSDIRIDNFFSWAIDVRYYVLKEEAI